jgi:septation ring formation regulator EzrA
MDDIFNPKKPKKYLCEVCDFVSCNKKDYDKHLLTLKHKKRTNGGQMDDVFTQHHIFNCECGKEYKHRQGLWKHKKICDSIKNSENDPPISSSEKQSEIKMLTELVKDVVKQNQDLTNKLVDICKNNSNTTISNNNINNTKSYRSSGRSVSFHSF